MNIDDEGFDDIYIASPTPGIDRERKARIGFIDQLVAELIDDH